MLSTLVEFTWDFGVSHILPYIISLTIASWTPIAYVAAFGRIRDIFTVSCAQWLAVGKSCCWFLVRCGQNSSFICWCTVTIEKICPVSYQKYKKNQASYWMQCWKNYFYNHTSHTFVTNLTLTTVFFIAVITPVINSITFKLIKTLQSITTWQQVRCTHAH